MSREKVKKVDFKKLLCPKHKLPSGSDQQLLSGQITGLLIQFVCMLQGLVVISGLNYITDRIQAATKPFSLVTDTTAACTLN